MVNEQVGAARNFEVTMEGNKFDQAELTIAVGDTVRWANDDGSRHSVTFLTPTAAGAPWTEKILDDGAFSERANFTTAGEFKYKCKFHQPGMNGTVKVQ
jgi:plastocyanin